VQQRHKFITATRTKTNDQQRVYGYQHFSAENYKIYRHSSALFHSVREPRYSHQLLSQNFVKRRHMNQGSND